MLFATITRKYLLCGYPERYQWRQANTLRKSLLAHQDKLIEPGDSRGRHYSGNLAMALRETLESLEALGFSG